jgi:hypothetical protein
MTIITVIIPYLESFLKVIALLQKHAIVHDDLWRGDPQIQDPIIHRFARL